MSLENPASKILYDFLSALDSIYGLHLDATLGFTAHSKRWEEMMAENPEMKDNKSYFGKGDPSNPEARYHHLVSNTDLVERNKKNGANQKLLANACIIYIYATWETVRTAYAKELNVVQKEIRSDVMGDIRHLRNSLMHSGGVLEKPLVVIDFLKVGDVIQLSVDQFESLMGLLFEQLSKLNVTHTGEVLPLEFARKLYSED